MMDYYFVLFWLFVFLIFIIAIVGIVYLSYWLPKKLGYKKVGVVISSVLTIGVLAIVFSSVFEDELFTESDAIDRLKEHSFIVADDAELISNEMGGIRDFHHRFELRISEEDKEKFIRNIRSSENYQFQVSEIIDIRTNKPRYSDQDTSFTATYENSRSYVYEFYKPNRQGYKPTWEIISVSKSENKLTYQLISD